MGYRVGESDNVVVDIGRDVDGGESDSGSEVVEEMVMAPHKRTQPSSLFHC